MEDFAAKQEQWNLRLTACWWGLLFVLAFGIMIWVAHNKDIVIADGTAEANYTGDSVESGTEIPIQIKAAEGTGGSFYIAFSDGMKTENVRVENRYLSKELHLTIMGQDKNLMSNVYIEGDTVFIEQAHWNYQRGDIQICLQMDGIYEYRVSMDGSRLKIEKKFPRDLYRRLVVVDPTAISGTWEESSVLKEIAENLGKDYTWDQIRIYNTDSEKDVLTPEQKAEFANALGADLYIGLGFDTESLPETYGISGMYNGAYYIPEFGNQTLADCLTRNVAMAVSNRAIGLENTEKNELLQLLKMPAAIVRLGCLNHEKERKLVENPLYQKKLEQGIADAIKEADKDYESN